MTPLVPLAEIDPMESRLGVALDDVKKACLLGYEVGHPGKGAALAVRLHGNNHTAFGGCRWRRPARSANSCSFA